MHVSDVDGAPYRSWVLISTDGLVNQVSKVIGLYNIWFLINHLLVEFILILLDNLMVSAHLEHLIANSVLSQQPIPKVRQVPSLIIHSVALTDSLNTSKGSALQRLDKCHQLHSKLTCEEHVCRDHANFACQAGHAVMVLGVYHLSYHYALQVSGGVIDLVNHIFDMGYDLLVL